ncbi:MAG TPA: hypothetical protein VGR27_02720 [Longimicrobiaceae bacterium]|nr:hypothetical protein [Longimicrobiaceae bacterium]
MSVVRRTLQAGGRASAFYGLAAFLLIAVAGPAAAQQGAADGAAGSPVEGRVVKAGAGQPGLEVTLHRVARDSAGVVGTTRSGVQGAFAFTLPRRDTTDFLVYFTTVDYLGVRYFGPALHPGDPAENYTVEVYDTVTATAGADPLRMVRRELILLPEEGRGWEVNEILQIRNEGRSTLVPGAGVATWEFSIPPGATEFEVGEGEIAPADVQRVEARVFVTAPLQPGTREIFLRYRLPDGERSFELPVDFPTENLNVYVRHPAPAMEASGLTAAGTLASEGESFVRYSAADAAPGERVRLEWQAPRAAPLDPRIAAIVLVLLFFAFGAVAALRRRPSRPAGPDEGQTHAPGAERQATAAAGGGPPL